MFIERNSARIWVEKHGESGPWVTLINGYTRPASDFRSLSRYLTERGFQTLLIDNRGVGRTEVLAPFTLSDMVVDVERAWGELQIDQTHLLGISMGGLISQHLAYRAEIEIERLILVSTMCDPRFIKNDILPWQASLESIKEKMRPYMHPSFIARNKLLFEAMCKQILKNIEDGSFLIGAEQQRAAIGNHGTCELLADISVPTLVLHGADDCIVDPAVCEEFLRHLPDARAKLYPKVGHLILAENSKQMCADIVDFIQI